MLPRRLPLVLAAQMATLDAEVVRAQGGKYPPVADYLMPRDRLGRDRKERAR